MAGLSLLAALIVVALSLIIMGGWSGDPLQEPAGLDTPSAATRSPGTSTLSHGGPSPAGMPGSAGSKGGGTPFLEPGYPPPERPHSAPPDAGGEDP